MKTIFFATATTILMLAAPLARSADDDRAPGREAQEAAAPHPLEEIIVSSRRREESLQQVPIAVTALTGENIRQASLTAFRDLQNLVPSLVLQPTFAPNTLGVSLRGQAVKETTLTVDPSIGLYIDGVALSKMVGAGITNLVDIERIEVLKGPQGTLFGRNTTGGAISIVTKDASDKFEGEMALRTGNYGLFGFSGVVNQPLAEGVSAVRVVAQYERRDAFGTNLASGRDLGGDLDGGSVRGTLRIDPTSDLQIHLRGDYSWETVAGFAWKPRGLLSTPPGSPATLVQIATQVGSISLAEAADLYLADANTGDFQNSFNSSAASEDTFSSDPFADVRAYGGSLTLDAKLGGRHSVKWIASYRGMNRDTMFDFDGSRYNIIRPSSVTELQAFAHELQLLGETAGGSAQYVVGAYYATEDGKDINTTAALVDINPRVPNNAGGTIENDTAALFGQVTYSFHNGFSVTAGLRQTWDDRAFASVASAGPGGVFCNVPVAMRIAQTCRTKVEASFSEPSYLFGIDYRANDRTLLYAKTSRGYRSGGFDLRATLTPEAFAPFRPETVTDYELGAKIDTLGGRMRVNTAAYYADYSDIQRSILIPTAASSVVTQITENAAAGTVYGAELEMQTQLSTHFDFNASVAYVNAKHDTFVDGFGNDLSNQAFALTPEWSYLISGAYIGNLALGSLRAQLDWAWKDDIAYNPEAVFDGTDGRPDFRGQAAFGLLNGRVTFALDSRNLEIAVWGKNLLDKEYYMAGVALETSFGINVGVPGEPRTFGIELRSEF